MFFDESVCNFHSFYREDLDKYARLTVWKMKEYYAVDGSMSGLFLEVESDIVSCSNNRPEEIIKEIFTPS